MKNIFRSGSYATVASTAALVVALGGTSYAAAQLTGADIKDGSLQTKDLAQSAQVTTKQVHNDNGTAMDGSAKTVLSLHVKPGSFVVSAKAQAYYSNTSPYVYCWLTGPGGNTLDYGSWYDGGGYGYGEVTAQGVFTTSSPLNVQFNCTGSNASLYSKKLSVIRVASAVDNLGPNVSKVSTPHRGR